MTKRKAKNCGEWLTTGQWFIGSTVGKKKLIQASLSKEFRCYKHLYLKNLEAIQGEGFGGHHTELKEFIQKLKNNAFLKFTKIFPQIQ